jgi:hypothetical protein
MWANHPVMWRRATGAPLTSGIDTDSVRVERKFRVVDTCNGASASLHNRVEFLLRDVIQPHEYVVTRADTRGYIQRREVIIVPAR